MCLDIYPASTVTRCVLLIVCCITLLGVITGPFPESCVWSHSVFGHLDTRRINYRTWLRAARYISDRGFIQICANRCQSSRLTDRPPTSAAVVALAACMQYKVETFGTIGRRRTREGVSETPRQSLRRTGARKTIS